MSAAQVVFTRGGKRESVHDVHIAVVNAAGTLIGWCGDPNLVTFPRSTSKPLQALPLAQAAPDLPSDELAMACASHAGTPTHLEVVQRLLARSGSTEQDLQCGTHPPFNPQANEELIRQGVKPGVLHHNCSGKHAGMLLTCHLNGWPKTTYNEHDHPLQQHIRALHAELGGVNLDEVQPGTDGCSVPAFALPLHGTARAFAHLAAPTGKYAEALARIAQAMQAHPDLIAGPGRLDTTLMPLIPGLSAKMGAEGFYGLALSRTPEHGPIGVALKIADGAERARPYAALGILNALGFKLTPELRALAPTTLLNWAGREVGTVETHVPLDWL